MGTADALYGLDLCQVASLIERREVSPVEVTETLLKRIDAIDPILNAFITVSSDKALMAARAAETAIAGGVYLGPLHGVPIALKDNIWSRGDRATAGSKIQADFVPEEDATVAARLRMAGALFLGKLNMHEFAYGVTTNNPHYGPARNPWNTELSPGGSSGGSGAAVAARLCYGALGTDTGCSVRLPAAYNGIVGIRPTIGRVSNYGIVTLAWTLDTCGPMTRSVQDCAVMLQAMAGFDARDSQTAVVPVPDYRARIDRGVSGLRLAVIRDFSLAGIKDDVARALETALKVLESEGATIREVDVPDLEFSVSALLTVDIAEPAAYHAEWLRTRPQDYGEDVRTNLELGEMYLATHYIQAQRYRTILRDRFRDVLADVEAIITPTVPFTAPAVGDTEVELETGERLRMIPAVMRYNALPPLTGMPALSLPCGFSREGLPIGMQLMGSAFDEGMLFRIGHAYQMATDWHRREPELAAS
jgi:aspartyl-tRNA(Asn)/glutamyl-tRNA(Gln) amidotransferase subunit A